MHHHIAHMHQQLQNLDSWTQLAVYGSWGYTVNAACINAAMRYVPELPVDNGIEHFTQYEAGRRALIKDADDSNLPSLLALQREISGWIQDNNGTARGLESTLEFMQGNVPDRKKFEQDYEQRRRMGMRPSVTLKAFVDYEYERAVGSFNRLVAKGQDAVRLCETISIEDMSGNDVPDWLVESFETKLIDKLHDRWNKLEMTRTDPRRRKEIRDSAEADQLMIATVLAEFNESVGSPELIETVKATDPFGNQTLDDVLPVS